MKKISSAFTTLLCIGLAGFAGRVAHAETADELLANDFSRCAAVVYFRAATVPENATDAQIRDKAKWAQEARVFLNSATLLTTPDYVTARFEEEQKRFATDSRPRRFEDEAAMIRRWEGVVNDCTVKLETNKDRLLALLQKKAAEPK